MQRQLKGNSMGVLKSRAKKERPVKTKAHRAHLKPTARLSRLANLSKLFITEQSILKA